MRKLWLAIFLVLSCPRPVSAVDLSIKDPLVSGLDITFTASLSASSNYYLQGTLRSQSSSKYFGETQNSKGDYIDYVSTPDKEYVVSNFFVTEVQNATWSGMVRMRFKTDDPNYFGPGLYDLKLRRFTGSSSSGSSAGDSNTLTINLTMAVPTPTPSPSPSPSPSPTTTPTPTPSLSPSSSPVGAGSPRPSPTIQISPPPVGTVAGVATDIDLSSFGISPFPSGDPSLRGQSSQAPKLNKSRAQTAIIVGSGLILVSLALYFGYRKYLRLKGSDLIG
ncbi:MAG: hypothetical protein WCG44_01960 [bacterium]